jgi:hypothetical protein
MRQSVVLSHLVNVSSTPQDRSAARHLATQLNDRDVIDIVSLVVSVDGQQPLLQSRPPRDQVRFRRTADGWLALLRSPRSPKDTRVP